MIYGFGGGMLSVYRQIGRCRRRRQDAGDFRQSVVGSYAEFGKAEATEVRFMAASLTLDEVYWVFENEPHRSRPRIFVETGTYQGTTVDRLRNEFDELHTIELSPLLYHAAVARFSGSPVRCHSGDSTNVLPSILAGIAEPVFLFLDAHWSGGETARGNVDVPLLAELAAVSRRTFCDIVVIDDVRLFGVNYAEDWSHVTMASVLGVFGPRLESWFERNDRLILYLSDGVA